MAPSALACRGGSLEQRHQKGEEGHRASPGPDLKRHPQTQGGQGTSVSDSRCGRGAHARPKGTSKKEPDAPLPAPGAFRRAHTLPLPAFPLPFVTWQREKAAPLSHSSAPPSQGQTHRVHLLGAQARACSREQRASAAA